MTTTPCQCHNKACTCNGTCQQDATALVYFKPFVIYTAHMCAACTEFYTAAGLVAMTDEEVPVNPESQNQ